jgi:hypothetical protein
MITLEIAQAKEQFLEDALQVVVPIINNGYDPTFLSNDVESLAQDTVQLFATLLRCDEQHNLLATTVDNYPYAVTEETLDELFSRFLAMCGKLKSLSETIQQKGIYIKNHADLVTIYAHARRLVNDDQSFYETTTYERLAEQAEVEYQTGQIEKWPA